MTMTKALVLIMFVTAPAIASTDYCSLIVQVISPNGKRPTAEVSVVDESGRTTSQIEEGKDARFCDLGLRPVTVEVGGRDTCNQVTVSGVPLAWNETYHLKVTYDPMPCLKDSPHILPAYCTYLFRVKNENGTPIARATLLVLPSNLSLKTDSAGRASFDPSLGPFSVTINFPGYSSRSFEGTCTPAKSREPQEEVIKLLTK